MTNTYVYVWIRLHTYFFRNRDKSSLHHAVFRPSISVSRDAWNGYESHFQASTPASEHSNRQESPPAWTQEAYRPPCSHSNFLAIAGGGGPWTKNFFSQSEHVSSQICCQKFFPLLIPCTPPPKVWDQVPPPENLRPGTPPENLRPGTPPPKC